MAMAYCGQCGSQLRATDRFCHRCGDVANATAVTGVRVDEFRPAEGRVHQLGDYIVAHAKGLLVLAAIGTLVGLGAILSQEKAVDEDTASPGYEMVRALKSSGAIDGFKAVQAEDGWTSEYSLDDGDTHIRFRGGDMEYEVSYDDGLQRAIESEARHEGFR